MSQIFKESFDKNILFDFIEKFSEKQNNDGYLFSKIGFKKAKFQKEIKPFCDKIKEFYYASKKKYIDRKMTYKNFVTIIRQICKYHHIPFTSAIKYQNSNYEIQYFIYKN